VGKQRQTWNGCRQGPRTLQRNLLFRMALGAMPPSLPSSFNDPVRVPGQTGGAQAVISITSPRPGRPRLHGPGSNASKPCSTILGRPAELRCGRVKPCASAWRAGLTPCLYRTGPQPGRPIGLISKPASFPLEGRRRLLCELKGSPEFPQPGCTFLRHPAGRREPLPTLLLPGSARPWRKGPVLTSARH